MIPRLGIEMEHFIIDRVSQRAVPYSGEKGVKEILYRLMARYPDAQVLPDDDFFGFAVPDFTVTLEPAAQLEISIAPMVSIRQITDVYRSFLQQLDSVLAPFGYAALSVGCHPTASVAELEQIPKKRYDLMSAHFQKTGTGGMEMMRGSASLQVSIDYSSQDDFRRKLQAAYYYGPVLKLLCDNAPLQPGGKTVHVSQAHRYLEKDRPCPMRHFTWGFFGVLQLWRLCRFSRSYAAYLPEAGKCHSANGFSGGGKVV